MLNNVVDSFGFDITIQEEKDQDWVTVRAKTGLHGAALWLTQYCKDSFAVSPVKLIEEVKENLRAGANHYN